MGGIKFAFICGSTERVSNFTDDAPKAHRSQCIYGVNTLNTTPLEQHTSRLHSSWLMPDPKCAVPEEFSDSISMEPGLQDLFYHVKNRSVGMPAWALRLTPHARLQILSSSLN